VQIVDRGAKPAAADCFGVSSSRVDNLHRVELDIYMYSYIYIYIYSGDGFRLEEIGQVVDCGAEAAAADGFGVSSSRVDNLDN